MLTRRLVLLGAALAFAGCTLEPQDAPSLTGPSELGLSLEITATPDIISQNGQAVATVSILALDGLGQPVKNLELRLETFVGDLPADYGVLSAKTTQTGADGRATVTYRAPAEPPPSVQNDTIVRIGVTPVGSNYSGSTRRFVEIRLTRPGVITPPDTDLKPVFTFSPSTAKVGDTVAFDASASSAGARTITSYAWSFGDSSTGSGKVTLHKFTEAGTFVVRLTITDDLGRSATSGQPISLGATLPKADFVFSPTDPLVGESVSFNGQTSTPAEGRTIVGYSWDFGDGGSATGVSRTHTFNQARTQTVVLTVTDDLGQTHSVSKTILVKDIQAVFTVSPTDPAVGANVSFNASGSKVAAGTTITSYSWDFGDSASSTGGPSTSHAYAAAGTYTVTLTIQDSNGRTGASSQTVTVAAP